MKMSIFDHSRGVEIVENFVHVYMKAQIKELDKITLKFEFYLVNNGNNRSNFCSLLRNLKKNVCFIGIEQGALADIQKIARSQG